MYKIIDAHCDTVSQLLDGNRELYKNDCMVDVEGMKRYDSYVQFFAAFVSKSFKNPMLRAVELLDKAKQEILKNDIKLILDSSDLNYVIDNNLCGAILSIEDARALCGELASLRFFYDYGVRAMTLAWNDDNEVTDGADSLKNSGLTPFGREAVKEMNRLNMIIDVSHITEKGFWDVLQESNTPIMASHSNCYSICSHRRNLNDEQIKALIKNNGLMCINIYPPFLENNPEDADINSVISHIEHVLSLGGEDILAFGSDFDGIEQTPKGINNVCDYKKIFAKMVDLGYNVELMDKITYKNAKNYVNKVI